MNNTDDKSDEKFDLPLEDRLFTRIKAGSTTFMAGFTARLLLGETAYNPLLSMAAFGIGSGTENICDEKTRKFATYLESGAITALAYQAGVVVAEYSLYSLRK